MSRLVESPEVQERLGTRAGIVSRLLADAIDGVVIVLLGLLVLVGVSVVVGLFTRTVEFVSLPQGARWILAAALFIGYLGYGWGLEGRTVGKTAMGLRVVRDDGSDLSPARGLLRALLYFIVLPGILWAVVSRRNASLQDLVLGTSVVHDWGVAGGRTFEGGSERSDAPPEPR